MRASFNPAPRRDPLTARRLRERVMAESAEQLALLVRAAEGPGILAQMTRVLADHGANIARVDIVERADGAGPGCISSWRSVADTAALVHDLSALAPGGDRRADAAVRARSTASGSSSWAAARRSARWRSARSPRPTATTSAASASRSTPFRSSASRRWPTPCARWRGCRARALLVLAGSLMGGEIAQAVRRGPRARACIVISLNMAGSVPDAADLVVSDPVQAGVMAVMAIADTAKFDIARQAGRQILIGRGHWASCLCRRSPGRR